MPDKDIEELGVDDEDIEDLGEGIKEASGFKKMTTDLEQIRPVEVTIDAILVHNDGAMAVLGYDEEKVALPVSSFEGTMLTFCKSGCAALPHTKTIYQMYLDTMTLIGNDLHSVTIEFADGDMLYARLRWTNARHLSVFATVTPGDALILSMLAGCKVFVLQNVLSEMDPFDDWPYEEGEYDF